MKHDQSMTEVESAVIAALHVLATEDLPLKDRLAKAWLDHLSRIDAERLSPGFRKKILAMQAGLSNEGLSQDSIDALTSSEALVLAEQIFYFVLDFEALRVSQSQ